VLASPHGRQWPGNPAIRLPENLNLVTDRKGFYRRERVYASEWPLTAPSLATRSYAATTSLGVSSNVLAPLSFTKTR
jgi:hypothetical protein